MQTRLPENIPAEQQILGALLMRDELFFDIADEITADDFFDRGHAAIYRTVESLVQSGKRVNVTLVRDYVGATEKSAKVEVAYLESLMDAVADLSDTIHYARQVADLARRRRIMNAMLDGLSKIGKADPLISSQSIIDEVETSILTASRTDTTSMRKLGEWAMRAVARIEDAIESPTRRVNGLKWGLTAVDNVIGPLMPGKLIVIGGRPGMGKSALVGQAAEAFGEQEAGYIQSLEMQGEEWAERAMAQHLDIAAWRIHRCSNLSYDDRERLQDAARRLVRLPVWIDHKTRLTVAQIRTRAIRYKHKHGIRWMIVDHGHIIQPSSKKLQPAEAVNENFYELKQIAKDLDVGLVALAQMNKEVRSREGGRPRAGDLLYYSSIEPHADSIIFPHRPEVVLAEQKPDSSDPDDRTYAAWKAKYDMAQGRAEIINAKARAGKAYLTQECEFVGPLMKFRDLQSDQTLLAEQEMAGW